MLDLSKSKTQALSLRVPRLPELIEGMSREFVAREDPEKAAVGMNVQQLVDGMDLDEEWCARYLNRDYKYAYDFVIKEVKGRAGRVDPLWPDQVTCYIVDELERQRCLKVPGRTSSVTVSHIHKG